MQTPTPLGEILLAQQLITPKELTDALAQQQHSGDRLGDILLAQGSIGTLALYQAIAKHYALPFINLLDSPADAALQRSEDLQTYIRLRAVPYAQSAQGERTFATSEPSAELTEWLEARFGEHQLVITSPYDLYWHLDHHFSGIMDEHSRLALWSITPDKSARQVLLSSQKRELLVFILLMAGLAYFFPWQLLGTLLLLLNLFYFFTLLLKCRLFIGGLGYRPDHHFTAKSLAELREDSLPLYTVLIPLHDESESLPRLLAALDALDYPKSKLDIKMIVEASDRKTIDALKALRPRGGYELVHVPYSLPQTKPKACNYALHFARGEYVTIYDAEDAPDPLQLKKAVLCFRQSPPGTVCLQARLNYYNRDSSILTRLFSLEYALWFNHMLPGLEKLRIPIPLGGTSNHLHLATLRKLGEWDPFNVTEDADLGIRIALSKHRTAMLDSLTLEEAPVRLKVWISQRTRWVRGYMQTWLVHMRHPIDLARQMPAQAFWGFQFFIGGPCLMFLTTPILWLFSIFWMAGWVPLLESSLSPWLLPLAIFNLGFGLASHFYYALHVITVNRWQGMLTSLAVFPLYWFLHSWAAYRAVWQLCRNPHIWEKTPHGHSLQ